MGIIFDARLYLVQPSRPFPRGTSAPETSRHPQVEDFLGHDFLDKNLSDDEGCEHT